MHSTSHLSGRTRLLPPESPANSADAPADSTSRATGAAQVGDDSRREPAASMLAARLTEPANDTQHARRPAVLRAEGVRKTYRTGEVEVEALRGIDMEIGAGEMVIVMGPSGHGKTTLLNCLAGLDDVDEGSIMVDGVDLTSISDAALTNIRSTRMGFVFQSFNLVPVLSAVENVELPLLSSGIRGRRANGRAMDMLDRVGLSHRARNRPAELSGGEQQRVAIARALVSEPTLIWADEPTGNLDSETAESVMGLLEEVHRDGAAMVIVTHDDALADRGDRLVRIVDGTVALAADVGR